MKQRRRTLESISTSTDAVANQELTAEVAEGFTQRPRRKRSSFCLPSAKLCLQLHKGPEL